MVSPLIENSKEPGREEKLVPSVRSTDRPNTSYLNTVLLLSLQDVIHVTPLACHGHVWHHIESRLKADNTDWLCLTCDMSCWEREHEFEWNYQWSSTVLNRVVGLSSPRLWAYICFDLVLLWPNWWVSRHNGCGKSLFWFASEWFSSYCVYLCNQCMHSSFHIWHACYLPGTLSVFPSHDSVLLSSDSSLPQYGVHRASVWPYIATVVERRPSVSVTLWNAAFRCSPFLLHRNKWRKDTEPDKSWQAWLSWIDPFIIQYTIPFQSLQHNYSSIIHVWLCIPSCAFWE